MHFTTLLALLPAAFVAAAPAPAADEFSGCYVYENPGCGINYGVCQCANGWFYQLNQNNGGDYCNPPWGIISTSNSGLPGWRC